MDLRDKKISDLTTRDTQKMAYNAAISVLAFIVFMITGIVVFVIITCIVYAIWSGFNKDITVLDVADYIGGLIYAACAIFLFGSLFAAAMGWLG